MFSFVFVKFHIFGVDFWYSLLASHYAYVDHSPQQEAKDRQNEDIIYIPCPQGANTIALVPPDLWKYK